MLENAHPALPDTPLRITEIFVSLQGEAADAGYPTTFVRLTGCPLRCQYCDTAYAFHGGEKTTVAAVVEQVKQRGVPRVCVTGGEPLVQAGCFDLMRTLCDQHFDVSLETSGAVDIAQVDSRVRRVVDIKTPGSNEQSRNRLANLEVLQSTDQLKFVICDRADYEWSQAFLSQHDLVNRCEILFSPSWGQLPPADLSQWMIADNSVARFQVQLHKVLWGDEPGR